MASEPSEFPDAPQMKVWSFSQRLNIEKHILDLTNCSWTQIKRQTHLPFHMEIFIDQIQFSSSSQLHTFNLLSLDASLAPSNMALKPNSWSGTASVVSRKHCGCTGQCPGMNIRNCVNAISIPVKEKCLSVKLTFVRLYPCKQSRAPLNPSDRFVAGSSQSHKLMNLESKHCLCWCISVAAIQIQTVTFFIM